MADDQLQAWAVAAAWHSGLCFFFSRSIGQVTPKIIHFYYLKKYFLDQSIQKNILFDFENRSTDSGASVFFTADVSVSLVHPEHLALFIRNCNINRIKVVELHIIYILYVYIQLFTYLAGRPQCQKPARQQLS